MRRLEAGVLAQGAYEPPAPLSDASDCTELLLGSSKRSRPPTSLRDNNFGHPYLLYPLGEHGVELKSGGSDLIMLKHVI